MKQQILTSFCTIHHPSMSVKSTRQKINTNTLDSGQQMRNNNEWLKNVPRDGEKMPGFLVLLLVDVSPCTQNMINSSSHTWYVLAFQPSVWLPGKQTCIDAKSSAYSRTAQWMQKLMLFCCTDTKKALSTSSVSVLIVVSINALQLLVSFRISIYVDEAVSAIYK